jgi:signal peptidase I
MRPTLQAGDLVFLSGANPAELRTGDIVAVSVPRAARDEYGLPAHVVHRIVKIEHNSSGLLFVTKGDANSGRDVFQSRPGDVVGKLELDVPGLGYPLLFLRSRQGAIFLTVAALVALGYFLLGVFEERRAYVEGSVATMQTLLEETRQLKQTIESAERAEARDVVDRLVGTVAEYGEHLRSHTAVVENLAATTAELSAAAAALREAVESAQHSRPGNGNGNGSTARLRAVDQLLDALRSRSKSS